MTDKPLGLSGKPVNKAYMDQKQVIKTALAAADHAILLDTPAQISRAAKAWRRCSLLGLDTEFVRERTYYANLGLVQISDGQTVWLLDPLVDGALAPLADLLSDHSIRKVFHSPSEDLEVLLNETGAVPDPLIDTQLACAMAGQSLQMGYHVAVEWLLQVEIDKELTRSNWMARPLKPELLRYAALDVCLLPFMWQLLEERLQKLGRLEWLQEDCARQLARARQELRPDEAWQRIRGTGRLDGKALAILSELAAWREKKARKRNLPRGFIIPDTALLTLARERVQSRSALEQVEGIHPRAAQRHGQALTELISQAAEADRTLPPPPTLSPAQRKLLKQLRHTVQQKADSLHVDPALLATKKDMEQIILAGADQPLPKRLDGWRHEVVTGALLKKRDET